MPIMAEEYEANTSFRLTVNYKWLGSPYHDFTVKVYSPYSGVPLTDSKGKTNMLYTDGREPSEFDYAKTINPLIPDYW